MIIFVVLIGAVGAAFLVLLLWLASRALHQVAPGRALVVSGSRVRAADGSIFGYRVLRAGRYLQKPLIEIVEPIDLRPFEVDAALPAARSADEVELCGRIDASVRVSPDAKILGNAVRRLLGVDRSQLRRMAAGVLQSAAYGAAAALSAADARGNLAALQVELQDRSRDQLERLGLECDQLSVSFE